MSKSPFLDLHQLPEDERIRLIGETAEKGHIVVFVVDDDPKAERYIKKLEKKYKIKVVEKTLNWIANTVVVKIGPRPH